jgi:hypothetical protein
MAYVDIPESGIWCSRERWLREIEESARHPQASYLLSAQGTFLLRDMDVAFCAGAWAPVIIIAHAVIDAILRDTEACDYQSSFAQTIW